MHIKNAGKVKVTQVEAIVKDDSKSKSARMKELFLLGVPVKEIAQRLSDHFGVTVRYNFVYNVVSNLINVEGIEVEKSKREGASKKDAIIAYHLAGMKNNDIAKELKCNYQYVYKTVTDYKKANPGATEVAATAEVKSDDQPTSAEQTAV